MIKLDGSACNGCGLCNKKCPFNAVAMIDKRPVFQETCLLCGICKNICPRKAISIETAPDIGKKDFSEYSGVWVFLQIDQANIPRKVSFELVSKARELADKLDQKVSALCLCVKEPQGIKEDLEKAGCNELFLVEDAALQFYDTDIFTGIASSLIIKRKPDIVLFPATEYGRDLAPRVAGRLRVGLTADCTGFEIDDQKRFVQIRPTYGGNIMASIITPNHRPQMATARPNVFQVRQYQKKTKMEIIYPDFTIDKNAARLKRLGEIRKENVFKDVAEAEIIIAGGYGLGKENFKLVHELAIKTGAAVGATRKAVDEGWAPFEIQIGQTGKTVAPRLYIACGISGALQHSIGVRNSEKIIAINSDPGAPIFSMADVSILGDAAQILKKLIQMADQQGRNVYSNIRVVQ